MFTMSLRSFACSGAEVIFTTSSENGTGKKRRSSRFFSTPSFFSQTTEAPVRASRTSSSAVSGFMQTSTSRSRLRAM